MKAVIIISMDFIKEHDGCNARVDIGEVKLTKCNQHENDSAYWKLYMYTFHCFTLKLPTIYISTDKKLVTWWNYMFLVCQHTIAKINTTIVMYKPVSYLLSICLCCTQYFGRVQTNKIVKLGNT